METSWVLADREAREEGVYLRVDGTELDATLPVELEPGTALDVGRDEKVRGLLVEPGALVLVVGKKGRVRIVRPGVNVDADAVRLHTDEATAAALADEVGAALEPDGDAFRLVGEDVLGVLATAGIPEADLDLELLPMPVSVVRGPDRTRPAKTVSIRRAARQAHRRAVLAHVDASGAATLTGHGVAPALEAGGERPPELVGWICRADACLVLGADGWAHECKGAVVDEAETFYGPRPPAPDLCTDLGWWSSHPDGLHVGAARYRWVDGLLVPAGGVR